MANSSREIRRRIKSVKNIGQITKAMELVSAAKMRKAQAAALASRPYSRLSAELLQSLMGMTEQEHPLLSKMVDEKNGSGKNLAILVTSNRGLAGSLNTNILNKTLNLLKQEGIEKFDFITVGKKGADAIKRLRLGIVAAFEGKEKNLTILDAKPVAQIAIKDFLDNKYEKVFLIFTDFISTLVQKPNVIQLLPLATKKETEENDILIEPSPDEVLDNLVYRSIEFMVYQSLVESTASEHSARMVAMRNANSAAKDLMEDLTLSGNLARQAGITRELAEISAAKLAMEN